LFQENTEEIRQIKKLEAQKEKIEELSTELEMMFNCTQDAMFMVEFEDEGFRYIRNNLAHQKLTSFNLTELKDKKPVELFGREIGEQIEANYRRCVEAGTSIIYEEVLILPTGKRTLLTTLTPMFEKGKVRYLVGSSNDITSQKKAEEELQKRLKYEKLISDISFLALQERSFEVFLTKSLRFLGESIGVSRVYLFEADRGKETVSNTFEWTASGITPQEENLQGIPATKFTWWVDMLKNRGVINYRDIEDISDEKTKEILRPQKIKSLLVLPVHLEGNLYGFVGFDDCLKNREWAEADINLLRLVASIISEYILRKKYEEKILFLSYHDNLTGLYNRRFLSEELGRLDTPCQLPLSVIMGGINGLKVINDAFGHEIGDNLLKKMAEVILENCRKEDVAIRWDGDTFIVFLPKADIETAEKMANNFKAKCDVLKSGNARLNISIGYSEKSIAEENIWKVLKEAVDSMYRNKYLQDNSYRNATISSLLVALYEKSTETEKHAERLAEICYNIGKELDLSLRELDELRIFALLFHDIGKVAIKESVLMKQGSLTEKEWDEMKRQKNLKNVCKLMSWASMK